MELDKDKGNNKCWQKQNLVGYCEDFGEDVGGLSGQNYSHLLFFF